MAPAGNPTHAAQPLRRGSRVVIPAIPLPYVNKQKQQTVLRQEAKGEVVPQTPLDEPQRDPTPPPTEKPAAAINGTPEGKLGETELVQDNGEPIESLGPEASAVSVPEQEVRESTNEESDNSLQERPMEDLPESTTSAPSEPPSSASRSTFYMPPAFVPANHNQSPAAESDATQLRFRKMSKSEHNRQYSGQWPRASNGHGHLSHGHPSNGHQPHTSNVPFMYGPGSNHSSPAPPLSGGFAAPLPYMPPHQQPWMPQLQYQANQFSQGPGGYSMMPYYQPQDYAGHVPVPYPYGHQHMNSYGPANGHSPSTTPALPNHQYLAYGPSNRNSIHGSQTSAHNEQENGTAHNRPQTNGASEIADDAGFHQGPPANGTSNTRPINSAEPVQSTYPPASAKQVPASHAFSGNMSRASSDVDSLDGLLSYLQKQFGNDGTDSSADYILEIRFTDDRAPPVRIFGHKLLFIRSPQLQSRILSQGPESGGYLQRTLLIESDDSYLRTDSIWMAVQRLYGGPLLSTSFDPLDLLPATRRRLNQEPFPLADRFDIVLGYIATGHILGISSVVSRGAELATTLINWGTVERALEFATHGGISSQWTHHTPLDGTDKKPTYGPFSNMIIWKSLNYIIEEFPRNFKLDASLNSATQNPRLPIVPDSPAPAHNHRLSQVKFGDYEREEPAPSATANSTTAILSRVLLELPFHLLQYILESPTLGSNAGGAGSIRVQTMHDVIKAREARRIKVLNSGHAPQLVMYEDFDDNVRWQELVVPSSSERGTHLERKWFETSAPSV